MWPGPSELSDGGELAIFTPPPASACETPPPPQGGAAQQWGKNLLLNDPHLAAVCWLHEYTSKGSSAEGTRWIADTQSLHFKNKIPVIF